MVSDPSLEKTESPNARFEGSSFIDPLTKLFNRYYLDQLILQEIKKATLSSYPLAILMIDVDKFKKINDGYGHLCGDKVLTQVADTIKRSIRHTDTAIRYAGDEFMILLPDAGKDNAAKICNSLINNIGQIVFSGDKNQKINVTLSIGYAIFPENAGERTNLIDMADKALYLSKKRGRNRFSSAKEVTIEEVSSLVAMESFPCRKFINRQKELGVLKEMVSAVVRGGPPQAALISGPSGTGKSRILKEIAANIIDPGITIYCNASSQRSQDPYYLFANGIDSYIDKAGINNHKVTDILLKMPSSELSELSLIIPQLRKLVKKSPDLTVDDKSRRFLIFKAFLDLLNGLSDLSPVFVIFDDTQYTDKASLELVRYLIKQGKGGSMFIICAFADDGAAYAKDDDSIQGILDKTGRSANVKRIILNNLSLSDTDLMVKAIFPGAEKSEVFTRLIHETTKGNPYFIEEMLKWLVDKGIIFYQKDGWQVKPGITRNDIPVSLDEIIKDRLISLDDETKEMILHAAVIGKSFQADILNKLGDKNEGFVSELIERAKGMHLVSDTDKAGGFSFINERAQDILYNQLDEAERRKIHYKIAQTLVDGHKDNIYNVAGEAAFHYSRVPGQEKAARFSKELLEKAKELFNPREINDYLEQFAQDLLARKDRIAVLGLSDKMMRAAVKFVLFVQGAIKKIRLYPRTSSVRMDTIKEVYLIISQIFSESDSLVITEVEKSLVINGKRLSPSELKDAKAEGFLHIMMEHGIKTISFKKGLREDELNNLVENFSHDRKYIKDKGGWAVVINKELLEHIGIDELHFISVDEYAYAGRDKKGLDDLMLMEFLLGKVDYTSIDREKIIDDIEKNPRQIAQTISDIASTATEKDKTQDETKVVTDAITKIDSQVYVEKYKGGDYQKDMAKVILELEPGLRNKVIRSFFSESREEQKKVMSGIMGALTDDFLIDMIIEKYKDSMHNGLLIKEFIDEVLIKEDRKKEILAKLEPKLLEIAINSADLSFVMGKITWEKLPAERKIDMLLGLPQDYYSGDALDKIGGLLKELDSKNKKEDIRNAVSRFLIKAKKLNEKARKNLLKKIGDFVKEPFNRIDYILERLSEETDPQILAGILEVIRYIIADFAAAEEGLAGAVLENKKAGGQETLFANKLFPPLLKKFKEEESKKSQTYEALKDFVSDVSTAPVLKELIYSVINSDKYDIKDIHLVFKETLIDVLIELGTKKSADLKDPFLEFLIKRQIASILMDLKEMSLDRMKKICLELKEGISPSLIAREDTIHKQLAATSSRHQIHVANLVELIGYLQSEEMIETLSQFTHHKDSAVRTAVIQALSEIGGVKAVEALSNIVREEQDGDIRNLANTRLQKLRKKIPLHK